jgi:hypothetical protein
MAPEQLIGPIILAVVLLINLLGRLMRTPPEEDQGVEFHRDTRPTQEQSTKPMPAGPKEPRRRRKNPQGTEAVGIAPVRLGSHRLALKNRASLRNAIVLLTVLGPCRAQEPFR